MGKELTLEQKVKKSKFFEKTDFGKIRCILTGHELPFREEDLLEYQTVNFQPKISTKYASFNQIYRPNPS
jgi:hypothetical protein